MKQRHFKASGTRWCSFARIDFPYNVAPSNFRRWPQAAIYVTEGTWFRAVCIQERITYSTNGKGIFIIAVHERTRRSLALRLIAHSTTALFTRLAVVPYLVDVSKYFSSKRLSATAASRLLLRKPSLLVAIFNYKKHDPFALAYVRLSVTPSPCKFQRQIHMPGITSSMPSCQAPAKCELQLVDKISLAHPVT